MKRNTFCFTLFISVAIVLSMFMPSCSDFNDEITLPTNSTKFLEMSSYTDYVFSNAEDAVVFSEAIKRIGLYCDNETIKYTAQSAESINISVELYDFIISLISNKASLLTRSNPPSDCVAQSLALWGCAYDAINDYITQKYGYNGVPESEVFSVIRHFYPDAKAHYLDSNNVDFSTSIITTVGYFQTGSADNGHMVNIDSIDSLGTVTYYDAQGNYIGSNSLSDYSVIYTIN